MKRKKHLLQHPPSPSMSLRQRYRHLSGLLRSEKDTNRALRIHKQMDVLYRQIHPESAPVKRGRGRPKTVQPEPMVDPLLQETLAREKLIREGKTSEWLDRPNPAEEHAARARAKAEIRKQREAADEARRRSGIFTHPPAPEEAITAPQSDDLPSVEAVAPPEKAPDPLLDAIRNLPMFR